MAAGVWLSRERMRQEISLATMDHRLAANEKEQTSMFRVSVRRAIRVTLAGLLMMSSVLTTRPITSQPKVHNREYSPSAVSLVPLKTIPIGKWVRSIAFSSDGSLLVAGTGWSDNGNVEILDVATGKGVTTLGSGQTETGHIDYVGLSMDGRLLVAKSWGRLSLWDVKSKRERRFWQSEGIWGSAAISPDGHFVAGLEAVGEGKRVKIFESETGQQVAFLPRGDFLGDTSPIAFLPNGKLFAASSTQGIVFWNVSNWRWVNDLSGISTPGIAFSPDSRLIAVISEYSQNLSATRIEVWDTTRKEKIASFGDPLWGDRDPASLSISPDGRLIATVLVEGGSRNSVTGGSAGIYFDIWDVVKRRLVLRKSSPPGFSIEAIEFSRDGKNIAWGGRYFDGPRKGKGEIRIWHMKTS
jgi:WD40 repeat protein